jgi:hypothetical protein
MKNTLKNNRNHTPKQDKKNNIENKHVNYNKHTCIFKKINLIIFFI